jgi:SMC interacting uncharacterized protein involved in chromosome segregation
MNEDDGGDYVLYSDAQAALAEKDAEFTEAVLRYDSDRREWEKQIAALKSANERMSASCADSDRHIEKLEQQIATLKAEQDRLREALEKIDKIGNTQDALSHHAKYMRQLAQAALKEVEG